MVQSYLFYSLLVQLDFLDTRQNFIFVPIKLYFVKIGQSLKPTEISWGLDSGIYHIHCPLRHFISPKIFGQPAINIYIQINSKRQDKGRTLLYIFGGTPLYWNRSIKQYFSCMFVTLNVPNCTKIEPTVCRGR